MGQPRTASANPLDVAILLLDGFHLSSAGAFLDLAESSKRYIDRQFRPIDLMSERIFNVFNLRLVGLSSEIVSSSGISFTVDELISCYDRHRLVVVPGFEPENADGSHMPGSPETIEWLQRQRNDGAAMAASGTSILLLGQAGLTTGLRVALPPRLNKLFAVHYPGTVIDAANSVSEDSGIFCSAGLGSDHALMALLTTRLVSTPLADWLIRRISVDSPFTQDPAHQGYSSTRFCDPLVNHAETWLNEHCSHNVTISDLASAFSVNTRTLTRRFLSAKGMTPFSYLQFLRIENAKGLLDHEVFTVNRIAGLVGYVNVGSFRQFFQAKMGMSPESYREARKHKRDASA